MQSCEGVLLSCSMSSRKIGWSGREDGRNNWRMPVGTGEGTKHVVRIDNLPGIASSKLLSESHPLVEERHSIATLYRNVHLRLFEVRISCGRKDIRRCGVHSRGFSAGTGGGSEDDAQILHSTNTATIGERAAAAAAAAAGGGQQWCCCCGCSRSSLMGVRRRNSSICPVSRSFPCCPPTNTATMVVLTGAGGGAASAASLKNNNGVVVVVARGAPSWCSLHLRQMRGEREEFSSHDRQTGCVGSPRGRLPLAREC